MNKPKKPSTPAKKYATKKPGLSAVVRKRRAAKTVMNGE